VNAIEQVFSFGADRTLLITYPAVASSIVTEWEVAGRPGTWDLSPMLRAEVFLLNTPFGVLQGYSGLSPTLSLPSECDAPDPGKPAQLVCRRDNASAFVEHFAARWDGDRPHAAAHFYYDAVVLLAMGLDYALSERGELPKAAELQALIREISAESNETASWTDLAAAFRKLESGTRVRYVGAATEYSFDEYGAAEHTIFDTWTIDGRSFSESGTLTASCPRNL
jgi:neutral amino acid transport system substrate-binding protein